MNWFFNHRQEWIAEMLRVYGFINRGHLVRKFGISRAQSTFDLQTFITRHPDAVEYNPSKKCYEAKESKRQA